MSKTPVSLLQEYYMKKGNVLPNYSFIDVGTTLTPQFKCIVSINNLQIEATASNKKQAKHNAALKILQFLQLKNIHETCNKQNTPTVLIKTEPYVEQNSCTPNGCNYIGMLNEYASTNGLNYPSYDMDIQFSLTQPTITIHCKFADCITSATANNKKIAKQEASRKMLARLKDTGLLSTPKIKINITPKKLNLDDHEAELEIVLGKFKELSVKHTPINKHNDSHEPKWDVIKLLNTLFNENDPKSLNSTVKQLQANGLHIYTYQTKPLILKARIPFTDKILFSYGDSFDEATKKMLLLIKKLL